MNPNTYITTNEDRVVICIEEYIDLIRDRQTLEAILEAIFEKAELSWDGKRMRFDDESICHVLSALCRNRYHGTLFALQTKAEKEKEAQDGTDKD